MGAYHGKPTLKDLFRAGFPLVQCESLDSEGVEREVRRALMEIDEEGGRIGQDGEPVRTSLGVWTYTNGMTIDRLSPVLNTNGESMSAIQKKLAFNQTVEFVRDSPESIVLIFHHAGSLIQTMPIVQLLLDTAAAAKEKYSTIIITGAQFNVPLELQSSFQYWEFPLPTKNELIGIFLDKILLPNIDQVAMKKPKNYDDMSKEALKAALIERNNDVLTEIARAATGLDPTAAENAFALSLIISNPPDPNVVRDQKRQIIKQSDVLEFIPLDETMADVGGFDNYQDWLCRRKGSFTDDAKEFGVTAPKGALFVGHAGTGKSLCCKATAAALKLPLLRFDMSKIFASLVGSSEAKMRNALRVAEGASPVVLWLDEVEKSISGSKSGDHDSGVTARVVGQFLQWRQETKAEVFVCCTSNNIHAIPPEFYRPGRIDAIFFVGMPDLKARMEIAAIHLKKRQRDPASVRLLDLAKATEGFTGAEIELMVVEALFLAYSRGKIPVTTELLLEAAGQIVPQSIRNKEEVDALIKWADGRALNVAKTPATVKPNPRGKRAVAL